MAVTKSAQDAINDFVEVIAQHYVAVQDQSRQSERGSVVEEFVSSIETDLKSTLRDRLSAIETVQEAEETPTVELSVADERQAKRDIDPVGATLDSDSNFASRLNSDVGHAGATNGEMATLDSTDGGDAHSKPVIRSGAISVQKELSYDDGATLDSGQGTSVGAGTSVPSAPDGYEVLSTLGKGGMGIVYKARHVPLNRVVAIKMIISGAQASAEQISRFQREAEAAAHLSHPNIVSVYEVGEHNGLPYFSLEFVDGKTVSDLMKETTFTAKRAAELLIPVSRGVEYSHQMGVLHRDLKPQNILLTEDGTPKVADFGLAKRLDDDNDQDKTREGVILGTPGYMAPEQARVSDKVGPQTDVYALGCILYYLMTGRPPFTAPTPFETVRQLLLYEPVAPSKLQTGLDKDLETICLKALEKDTSKRYASAAEFADELQRFVDGTPIIARPITSRERLWKWCKRNPRVATLSGLAASLLMCLLFGGIISAIVINQKKKAEQVARAEAEENAKLADDQAELAIDSTRLILYEAKEFFESKPELRPLRENMIGSILEGVERLHTDRYAHDVQGTFAASADSQLGQIYYEAGAFDKAIAKLLDAERQLVALNAEGKLFNADVSQMNITLALGDTYRAVGELNHAEEQYLSLEKQRKAYFQRNPDLDAMAARQSMAQAFGRLASIYSSLGKPKKSMDYMLQSIKVRREAYEQDSTNLSAAEELAGALRSLSANYEKSGETEKMLDASRQALQLQAKAAEAKSDMPSLHNTALSQKILARQYLVLDMNRESQSLLSDATATLEQLLLTAGDDQRIQAQAADAYYWQGVALERLNEDALPSFRRNEELLRQLIAKSANINNRGSLLKNLARAGRTEEAITLADEIAASPDKMMNCGYAACGYALLAEHLGTDDSRRDEYTTKAIELTQKLIEHGYHDFESLRTTDIDFAPLQQNPSFLKMLKEEEARVADHEK